MTKYGTASLVKSEFFVENIRCDTEGRILVFDIGNFTFANIYLISGTDGQSRSGREKLCSADLKAGRAERGSLSD
jgi:hypothetical protein